MSPLRYKVVVYRPAPLGDTTRDPEPAELSAIQAYVGAFVTKHGKEPGGVHDVPGLEPAVFFQTIHQ